jgi:chemotaxis protein CheC
MEISELELDALTELANVGLSRAAKQLSELLSDFIEMESPSVQVVRLDKVEGALQLNAKSSVAAVWQNYSGQSEGSCILIFPSEDSKALVRSLVGPSMMGVGEDDIRAIELDAMMEIGNIIITSGMVVIAEMLRHDLQMSIPRYMEGNLHDIMSQQNQDNMGKQMLAIVMSTHLKASKRGIQGQMVMLMTITSVRKLFAELNNMFDNA